MTVSIGGLGRIGRRLAIVLLVAGAIAQVSVHESRAQTEVEARALHIERQLLCPQCTNLRLDVCETQICIDMRAVIRERIAEGQPDSEIIDYFTGRYGDRVLADVPREGFNLWLFGWVGASMLLVASLGAYVLLRLRRTAAPEPEALSAEDDRWLQEQLTGDPDRGGDG